LRIIWALSLASPIITALPPLDLISDRTFIGHSSGKTQGIIQCRPLVHNSIWYRLSLNSQKTVLMVLLMASCNPVSLSFTDLFLVIKWHCPNTGSWLIICSIAFVFRHSLIYRTGA
jgi:hypothetical protein